MIKIICVGKLKEKYFTDAVNEYKKRLQKYTKLEIIEVSDVSTDNEEMNKNREMELIVKHISEKDFIITLEIEGKTLTSVELSKKIENWTMNHANITFIIGGSNGLHQILKKRSHYALSFSTFTFPHQLFRVLLLEQIYRSYKISNNESYHK